MTEYIQKLHAFQARRRWQIEPGGVRWEELEKEMKSGFISYDNIKRVRLRYEPSRSETRRVGLHIHADKHYHITNIDYEGVLNFKLQSETFNPFVRAFHAGFPSNTTTRFLSGSTWPTMIFNLIILVMVGALLFFLAPIVAVTGIPGGTSIFRIVLIMILLPVLIRIIRRNWPKEYTAETFPEEMLID